MSEGLLYIPFERPQLVGREADLARVHAALNDGTAAITPAITGQGGIGKTQLAVRSTANRKSRHPADDRRKAAPDPARFYSFRSEAIFYSCLEGKPSPCSNPGSGFSVPLSSGDTPQRPSFVIGS